MTNNNLINVELREWGSIPLNQARKTIFAGPTEKELRRAHSQIARDGRLAASVKQAHPDWSDRQIQMFIDGRGDQ